VAATALQHPGDGLVAQVEGREQVELDLGGDRLRAGAPEGGSVVQARVVDEHVDRPGLRLHALDQPSPLGPVEQVARVGRAAHLVSEGSERGGVARHQGDCGARSGHGARDLPPDPARRPCDQHACALQLHRRTPWPATLRRYSPAA
jgi:hypothetical protein